MKTTRIITAIAAVALTLGVSGCADLVGVGVDYGPSGIPPVYYNSSIYVPTTPFWGTSAPLPPLWGSVPRPTPVRPPMAPQGPQGSQGPQGPQVNPGNNGNPGGGVNIPNTVGGQQRPGNGGLPTQGSINSSPQPFNPGSNNSRR